MTSTLPDPKRQRTSPPLIGTHSGTFHADESLAVYLLRLLPEYAQAALVRTRDPKKLAECDIVVDVGGEYDAEKKRFDHHQRGFSEVFGQGYKTKLSSAGLVYKHFGHHILAQIMSVAPTSEPVSVLYNRIYEDFVEALDGIDNGVSLYPSVTSPPAYRSKTDLSSRVGHLNPRWNETSNDDVLDARFEKASKLAGEEFVQRVDYLSTAWLPARKIVEDAVKSRMSYDDKGRIVRFSEFAPWKKHLHVLEEELQIPEGEKPLYVLYPDESGKWRIQAVPKSSDSFESRKALPEPWRGVRDDALSELAGIDGCIFVHASGFIGGNQTEAGAMAMAQKALTM